MPRADSGEVADADADAMQSHAMRLCTYPARAEFRQLARAHARPPTIAVLSADLFFTAHMSTWRTLSKRIIYRRNILAPPAAITPPPPRPLSSAALARGHHPASPSFRSPHARSPRPIAWGLKHLQQRKQFHSSPRTEMGAVATDRVDTTARVAHLRALMAQNDVQAYVIPSEDQHASEYPADSDLRRGFITGFTGSAGTAVVTTVPPATADVPVNKNDVLAEPDALLFTDGRYFLQAGQQLQPEVWKLMRQGEEGVPTWTEYLTGHLPAGVSIGVDASLLAISDFKDLAADLEKRGSTLKPLATNLVDEIWNADGSRPPAPRNEIFTQPLKYAGKSVAEKVKEVREEIAKLAKSKTDLNLTGFVATMLDEVAWLYNLRGTDVPYNPVFFAFALVPVSGQPSVYLEGSKLTAEAREQLEEAGVLIKPYESFYQDIKQVGAAQAPNEKMLLGKRASLAVADALGGLKKVHVDRSPVIDLKSIKNEVELDGFRHSHILDGAALANYFAWLEAELAAGKQVHEWDGSVALLQARAKMDNFKGESFTTISSTGSNAAVIHYSPNPEPGKSKVIDRSKIYLCDSGAQFVDGTTDVTRTLHFCPDDEDAASLRKIRTAFTRVLQGHIAIDQAVFPRGTTGYQIDVLARRALWEEGLDYRHGTSHGVGSFLNVHEGPAGIGTRLVFNETPLKNGMVLSNEPGYYQDGQWGIRIENLIIVREANTPNNFGEKGFLTFEHVTLCPIQVSLIDAELLTTREKKWINDYHDEVLQKVAPVLEKMGAEGELGLQWLKRECGQRV